MTPIATDLSSFGWRRVTIAVFVLSLFVRLLFVLVQESYHIFDIYFFAGDSVLYDDLARSLISGGGYSFKGRPTAVVAPGYPLFLAALYALGIGSTLAVGVVQCVLGAATCAIIAVIGRYVAGDRAGLIAGVLAATYVHLVWWTGYILTETLFVWFVVAAFAALVHWQRDVASDRRGLYAGLLLGFGALTRPHLIGFGIVLAVLVVFLARGQRRAALRSGAWLLLGLTIVMTPWAVRNYFVFGVPIAGSTLSGAVLYQGNSYGATGGTGGYLDARDFKPLDMGSDLGEVESNRAYSRAAWEFIRQEPASLPRLAFWKFVNQWRPTYEGSSFRNFVIFGSSYVLIAVLAIVGIVRAVRRGPSNAEWMVLAGLAFFVVLHMIVPGMIRYRLPAEPFLILLAAVTIDGIWGFLSRRGAAPGVELSASHDV